MPSDGKARLSAERLGLPQFDQRDVLKVTGLQASTLQTWVNRRLIELSEPNPGTGARRRYSVLDCVRLAVMRRLTDCKVPVGFARSWTDIPLSVVAAGKPVNQDVFFVINGPSSESDQRSEPPLRVIPGRPEEISLQDLLDTRNKRGDISDIVFVIHVGRIVNEALAALDSLSTSKP